MRISSRMTTSTERGVAAAAQARHAGSRYVVDITAPRQRFFSSGARGVNRVQGVQGGHAAAAGAHDVRRSGVKSQLIASLLRRFRLVKLPRAAGNGERGNLLLHDRPMQRPANWRLRTDAQDDSR